MADATPDTITLDCRCGATGMAVSGVPIMAVECACTSCRTAAQQLGDPDLLTPYHTTPCVMVRKDRVAFVRGTEHLRHLRLTPQSSTRRVVATCCQTPMFLEFEKGHWLSLYSGLWPVPERPAPILRTMTGDLPTGTTLPDDIPNARRHTFGFMARLLGAWIAMGFRVPTMPVTQPLQPRPQGATDTSAPTHL